MKLRAIVIVVAGYIVVVVLCTAIIFGVMWKRAQARIEREAEKAKAAENLERIAHQLITDSNTNNGKYPRTYFFPTTFPATHPAAATRPTDATQPTGRSAK